MKTIVYSLLLSGLLLLSLSFSFEKTELVLTCKMDGCERVDSLYMFEFNGVVFSKIGSTQKLEDGSYQFRMPMLQSPRFYYVGNSVQSLKPIILGTEKEVGLTGPCINFRGARVKSSTLNEDYFKLKNLMNKHKGEFNGLHRKMQRVGRDSVKAKDLISQIKNIDDERLALLDSLKKTNPYLANVAAFNTYLSYFNYGEGYATELQYFVEKYFQFVDWTSEDNGYMPWVYEGTKAYSQTISSLNMAKDKHQFILENLLKKIPEDTRTYKLAYGGILAGMQQKNHPNYLHFGEAFIQKYKGEDILACVTVRKEIKRISATVLGGEAPDFTMKTPAEEDMSLKDFRGKYVLIDFWASWCGPCRRENPNVVKMYNKYKGEEFEILGVSLDRQKDRWLQAIEKDGLTWPNVSDLKGWQNAAAKKYGVSSIPHTVLVDKEGKIIARNLRGPALEAKLKSIFGK